MEKNNRNATIVAKEQELELARLEGKRLKKELTDKELEFNEMMQNVLQIKTKEIPEVAERMKTELYVTSEKKDDLIALDTEITD